MSEYTGGAAFPLEGSAKRGAQSGMTLRDYFAAKAMQSMVAAEFAGTVIYGSWAESAYAMADAILKERAK